MPDDRTWATLTASPRKRELFADDLYFREAWEDLRAAHGEPDGAPLQDLALFNFKSDGVIGHRMRRTMEFFADAGFTVAGWAPMRHNRHSMREVWRYDWNLYTTDRLALTSLMHGATETLLLILRDTRYDGVVPASVRLAGLKGAVDQEWTGQHLRTVLRPPNRVINFCHIADEPADLVREIGIFLDRPARRELLRQIRAHDSGDLAAAVTAEIARLEAAYPAHAFDLPATLSRLADSGRVPADGLVRIKEAAGGGPRLGWDELCAVLPPGRDGVELWDFVLVASEVLPLERTGHKGLLPAPAEADWRRHHDTRLREAD